MVEKELEVAELEHYVVPVGVRMVRPSVSRAFRAKSCILGFGPVSSPPPGRESSFHSSESSSSLYKYQSEFA